MKHLKFLSIVLALALVTAGIFAFTSGADNTPVSAVADEGEYVTYEAFGAAGDGVTDDYAAIRAAHEYANAEGLPVKGKAGATYYLGTTAANPSAITIKTSTDWQGAKFIIDDRDITKTSHPYAQLNIFEVKPTLTRLEISPSDIGSLSAGATNLGYAPGVDCLVHIENSNVKHYIRYGQNANSGSAQQEVLLVRANGDIDKSTAPIWDYDTITYVWAVPVDEAPITVGNGTFETLANEINPDKYLSVNRGIRITRSNTTVSNVKHTVTQVKDYRAAYGGFFNVQQCNNVLIYNCEIFCHNSSYFDMPDGSKNLLGSYELGANNANNVYYDRVIQTNFFDVENEKVHNQGLMGTNYCKNMYVTNSRFARFDAHCQVYNLTVKNSELQRVNTIGFGTVKIENTNFWGSYMVDLRSDYGGLFDGDFYIKNVTMKDKTSGRISIFSGSWNNHYFGYTVVQPQNLYIENLKVEKNSTIYLYTSGLDNQPDLTADTVNDEENLNPIVPTKLVKVITNPANTRFMINKGPTFANTVLEAPEREEEQNVYHVNCDFSDGLTVNSDGYITACSSSVNGYGSIQLQLQGNGHNYLNLKTTMNGEDRALLFSGCGNPTGATNGTNICVDVKPSSNTANTEYDTYMQYKGKSFVISYDIKPLEHDTDYGTKEVQLFGFGHFYKDTGTIFEGGMIVMKLETRKLYIHTSSAAGYRDLNVALEANKFSNIALHVNVLENKYDLYVNDIKVAGGLKFLKDSEIEQICTYADDQVSFVPSAKSNKMEDFLFSYARLARVNGWEIQDDVYEFDNAKLYFSDVYLGTGDLNAKNEKTNQFQTPNASYVSSVISSNYGNLNHYVDKTGSSYTGGTATKWEDGNNNSGKNIITVYDGPNGAAGTTIANNNTNVIVVDGVSYSGSQIKNQTNIFTNAIDPVTNTDAIALKKYNASAYMLNCGLVKGVDYWVTKNGNTFTVVPEGTAGAYRAQVTTIDEGNNGNLQRLGGAMDLVENKAIVSVNFRWAGETAIDRLIEPCFSTIGFNSAYRINVLTDGILYANNTQIPLAKLTTDRYYTVTAVYYALEVSSGRYSMFYDVYLDGICLAKKIAIANVADKTLSEITGNGEDLYGLRYFANLVVNANINKSDSEQEYVDATYVRSVYEYLVDNEYVYDNLSNSGNTIEGYQLSLGSKLELNYYMNLIPSVLADANAEVVFTVDGEIVVSQKIAGVTPDDKGLYKFTCPINSTQMAADIKVVIKSGSTVYNIYMDGNRSTEHTYSVAKYAKTILESEDEALASAKPVVKAMVNYGAAAQTYFAQKNDTTVGTLANVGFEFTQAELDAADFGDGAVSGATAGMTAALVLDTDTVIKIYKNGVFVGQTNGITADNLDEEATIVCSSGETVRISVLTVCEKVTEKSSNENYKNLVKALALYSAASDYYKTNS